MSFKGWKYYNHAMIPTSVSHENPDLRVLNNADFWKKTDNGAPFLARWTTDWDCGNITEWWYVIKDDTFDISDLKAKRRYEINKGIKNYEVKNIDANSYTDELFDVTLDAYTGWPAKYRPIINKEQFIEQISKDDSITTLAAFDRETGSMTGYARLHDRKSCVDFNILRTRPGDEKRGVNAAILYEIMEYYKDRFDGKFYICDGARSIRHETAFQDYLEKYFGFRKAYCRLNIRYRKGIGCIVKILFPFRKLIGSETSITSQLSAILKMEEIVRSYDN